MVVSRFNTTGSKRISEPINALNSEGEISPKPLNLVISTLPDNFFSAFLSLLKFLSIT